MLFNSLAFLVFLPIVFVTYWLLQKRRVMYQNLLLLVASYIFYGWWDYRFLALIFISSVADYIIGLRLDGEAKANRRKFLLAASLAINLGILGFFKYFGFFVESAADLLNTLGVQANPRSLQIILPVGISFYTFQTLSYTIDIYRKQIPATRDVVSFFAFVSFFPQLVAGPIERARRLLPQFFEPRAFDDAKAKDGLRQMLWGMFKKVVIADNVAGHVDQIFSGYEGVDSVILVIGSVLFAIQIYCDFSGYSDIAIGTARLFGFSLMRNFAFPYFSRDIAEFWRRWHVSLSSWFRDYVYIPLGGSRVKKPRRILNIIITFGVSGFWHGANWTFIVWGLLHGLYYIPLMLFGKQKQHVQVVADGAFFPSAKDLFLIPLNIVLVLIAWVFFRAESVTHATSYLSRLATGPLYNSEHWHGQYLWGLGLASVLFVVEWFQRNRQHGLEMHETPRLLRWSAYVAVSLVILLAGNFGAVDFIYFQF